MRLNLQIWRQKDANDKGGFKTFTGELTVAGTTNEATFTINALVRDDGFGVITGSTTITWEDYGVTPPNAPIVVSIDESGIVEFQLIVTKG